MPLFGAVMAKMLFVLLNTFVGMEQVREDSNLWCGVMLGMAIFIFFACFA